MADVYCSKCFAPTSDRSTRCRTCKRWNSRSAVNLEIGGLLISGAGGAIITAIYARVMHLGWERWLKVFEGDPSVSDSYAEEAATLIGAAVFLLTAVLTALAVRPGRDP